MKPIVLVGPMGAGKSTIGRLLAKSLNFTFEDSDHVIEARTGANIPWIFDLEGEQGFRDREQSVLDELSQLTNLVLATGGGAVVRLENQAILSSRCVVVYLHASISQQLARTEKDRNRPLLQQDDPQQVLENLFNQRHPIYTDLADIRVETDGRNPKSVATEIVKKLKQGKLVDLSE